MPEMGSIRWRMLFGSSRTADARRDDGQLCARHVGGQVIKSVGELCDHLRHQMVPAPSRPVPIKSVCLVCYFCNFPERPKRATV